MNCRGNPKRYTWFSSDLIWIWTSTLPLPCELTWFYDVENRIFKSFSFTLILLFFSLNFKFLVSQVILVIITKSKGSESLFIFPFSGDQPPKWSPLPLIYMGKKGRQLDMGPAPSARSQSQAPAPSVCALVLYPFAIFAILFLLLISMLVLGIISSRQTGTKSVHCSFRRCSTIMYYALYLLFSISRMHHL